MLGTTDTLDHERTRLAQAADFYDSRRGLNHRLVRHAAEIILSHAAGPRLLELGCANGAMTELFARRLPEVVVVEGAPAYAQTAQAILGDRGTVHCCLFEEFAPSGLFNDIVLAGVLEHVAEPVELLRRAAGWLAPGGNIHIVVPNALSLHRRMGVALGLLAQPDQLHAADFAMGHRRVYSPSLLSSHLQRSGLRIIAREGNFLKPLSNRQLADWPEELLEALAQVGRELPELCAELYFLCRA